MQYYNSHIHQISLSFVFNSSVCANRQTQIVYINSHLVTEPDE